MIEAGYQEASTLEKRIKAAEDWLRNPVLLKRDPEANYAAILEIDLAEIKEPILACPNDPDDVKYLSEVAGDKIDEVFIGSCMTTLVTSGQQLACLTGLLTRPPESGLLRPPGWTSCS